MAITARPSDGDDRVLVGRNNNCVDPLRFEFFLLDMLRSEFLKEK